MPIERLSSSFDPRVADYRHIAEADLVKSRGLFVAEGRLVVKRLIEDGYRFRSVLVNDTAYQSLEAALTGLAQHAPVYICETTDLSRLPDTTFIVAALRSSSVRPRRRWAVYSPRSRRLGRTARSS